MTRTRSTEAPRLVAYCGVGDDLAYERRLLEDWHMAQRIILDEVDPRGLTPAQLVAVLARYDGLVTEQVALDRTLLDALPRLRVVALQSIGTDAIDLPAAAELGIEVSNAPGFCVDEVASHAVALILDLARQITAFDRDVQRGAWNPLPSGQPIPRRLTGQTVGLVFFGAIPQRMVAPLAALGFRMIGYAPTKTRQFMAAHGVEQVESLDELLRRSDFVSVHAPLSKATYQMIGKPQLALMKASAYLVNTARGQVVDEAALVAALDDGLIAGAAVDVIEDEANGSTALRGRENVVLTPHAAFLSEESFLQAREMALSCLVDVLVENRPPRYAVAAAAG